MKKKILFVVYNVVAVISLFLLFEFFLRVFDTKIILSGTDHNLFSDSVYYSSAGLIPGSIGKSHGIMKEVDSLGFWKYSSNKNTDKNLLIVGDSVTMGIGVENDSTFTGRLANSIDSLRVFNASLIGYNVNNYKDVVEKLLLNDKNNLRISSVNIFWCLNDLYSNFPGKENPQFAKENNYLGTALDFLRENSKVFHFIKNTVSDRSEAYYKHDIKVYTEFPELVENAILKLKSINEICKASGVELSIFILPYEFQLRTFVTPPPKFSKNYLIKLI